MVRICLVVSLVAVAVHQTALHHKYEEINSEIGSFSKDLESKVHESPTTSAVEVIDSVVVGGDAANVSSIQTSNRVFAKPTIQNNIHFVPAPAKSAMLAYFYGTTAHKLYEPVIRAFHSRGWSVTKDETRAHVLWFDQPEDIESEHQSVKPWQRINQLPNTNLWDDKDHMAKYINAYYAANSHSHLHSFPESYVLNDLDDMMRFQDRLANEGGLDIPWVIKKPTVNQGKVSLSLRPISFFQYNWC
jgi:hypothetical protein